MFVQFNFSVEQGQQSAPNGDHLVFLDGRQVDLLKSNQDEQHLFDIAVLFLVEVVVCDA